MILNHSTEILNRIRQQSDSVLLFYSCGKDFIVCLDLLSKAFKKVYAVQMYFVKGLDHIEKYIKWSEQKYNNVEFISVPHWNLSFILKYGVYCNPNPEVKIINLHQVDKAMRQKTGCQFSFYGMKQADSMNRLLMLRSFELEGISKTGKVYPLSKWKDADVKAYIRLHKLIPPIDYGETKKSHGLTFSLSVFLYLEKYYPQDLKKILDAFPLAEQILFEHYGKNAN